MTEVGKDFVDHSGVKGMKWGVRRSESELGRASGAKDGDAKPKKAASKKESSTNSRNPTKSFRDMSDKELKAYVGRLNMEQQYARMQPTPWTRKAVKFVSDIAVGAVKQQLTNQLSSEIGKQLGSLKTRGLPPAPNPLKADGAKLLITPPKLGTRRG
jgi:hypothetical protein